MNLTFHVKDANLNDRQHVSFATKMARLVRKLGKRWVEEASEAKISVLRSDTKAPEERFTVEIVISIPGHRLVAREQNATPDNALDACIEKLRKQMERVKA